ncbi:SGNH hydrolase [Aspergillus campestris IBT 28561]|uniref:SGNH hydrolase n=1 Tax=Aspergillus campestris (strain IBT 28561) TaxID=1392248 RepID=A0A2I1D204_ASPC2|nr:SGNH hydrolase [Aspergillus campestris IBT 28561]PKY03913.1 SGNH hydrolase [Aspergillus campestris IBT 28561]
MRPTSLPLAFASLLLLAPSVYSTPVAQPLETPAHNDTDNATEKPFALRTMPLGASITFGERSTDKNGYRGWLRKQMRFAGWDVNMVGSVKSGEMEDNDNEGHSGFVVKQVAKEAEKTIPQAPNLILINAGTNDAIQNNDIDTIDDRMNALLDRLFTIPDTTVILSTLIPNGNPGVQPRVDRINTQYRDIVRRRRQEYNRIVLAEMSQFIKLSDLQDDDKTHPTDAGYKKMAAVWWAAIEQAEKESLLRAPKKIEKGGKCEEGGHGGGDDVVDDDKGRVLRIGSTPHPDQAYSGVRFANLVKKSEKASVDELVWARDGESMLMFGNDGEGKFGKPVEIAVKEGCVASDIRWADFNNDGLDDFICIAHNGGMSVSINKGGNPPKFESIGHVRPGLDGVLGQGDVRLGDIDGDGRVDYCLVANNDLYCWRNGGQRKTRTTKTQVSWQFMGLVVQGKDSKHDIADVQLADIDGDNRSDLVWVEDKGKVTALINTPASGKGSTVPEFKDAGALFGDVKNIKVDKDRVRFGSVYPNGGSDYAVVESEESGDKWDHYLRVWKNTKENPAKPKLGEKKPVDVRELDPRFVIVHTSETESESESSKTCPVDDKAAKDDGDVSVDPRLPVYAHTSSDSFDYNITPPQVSWYLNVLLL